MAKIKAAATAADVATVVAEAKARIAKAMTKKTDVKEPEKVEEHQTVPDVQEVKEPQASEKKEPKQKANTLSAYCYQLLEKSEMTDKEISDLLAQAYPCYKGTDVRTVRYYRDRLNIKRLKLNLPALAEIGGTEKVKKSKVAKEDPCDFMVKTIACAGKVMA